MYLGRGSVARNKKGVGGMDHVVEQKNKNKFSAQEIFRVNFFLDPISRRSICVPICVLGGTHLWVDWGLIGHCDLVPLERFECSTLRERCRCVDQISLPYLIEKHSDV